MYYDERTPRSTPHRRDISTEIQWGRGNHDARSAFGVKDVYDAVLIVDSLYGMSTTRLKWVEARCSRVKVLLKAVVPRMFYQYVYHVYAKCWKSECGV